MSGCCSRPRALSDLGRRDLALEVVADVKGRAALRLRSDIYWAAHKWREIGRADRAHVWRPLETMAAFDRHGTFGHFARRSRLCTRRGPARSRRFRDRYGPKMAGTPDARAFEIVSAPIGTGGENFKEIAHAAAAADTLDDFLREMKARYPESNPISSEPTADAMPASPPSKPSPAPPAAAASAQAHAPLPAPPPQTRPARPAGPAASAAPPAPVPTSAAPGRTAMR